MATELDVRAFWNRWRLQPQEVADLVRRYPIQDESNVSRVEVGLLSAGSTFQVVTGTSSQTATLSPKNSLGS